MNFVPLLVYLILNYVKFSFADELVVDVSGNGVYTSIQDCVDAATSGDSCLVRKGRYHEVVTITNKTNINIKGYQDEMPIIDGTVVLKPLSNNGTWTIDGQNGACMGEVTQDVFQLFLNEEMMTNARWPNALWSDKSVFNNTNWAHSDNSSVRGKMFDDGGAGLAASGLNMTGAMAVLNVGSFNTFVKPVTWHEPGKNRFRYKDDFGDINFKPAHNQYYLDSSLELLDNPGEWHYDKENKILRFIPLNGGCPDPDTDVVRGRVIDYSMIVTKTKGLTIANMEFFATNIYAEGSKKKVDEIGDIKLDSITFMYPSSSKRMLQDYSVPKKTMLVAKMFGDISVTNCNFIGAEGSALYYWSKKSKIHNNLFAWNDWSGQMGLTQNGGYGTVYSSPTSKDEEFVGNTLWYNGASAGYRSGKSPTVKDNLLVGQCSGEIMNDGSGIQIQTACQDGATIEGNWVYDSPKYGIRFDHSPNKLGRKGTMSKNVVWNTKGIMVKGDEHTVEKNLALDNIHGYEDAGSLLVIHILRLETPIHNENTTVTDNAATLADGGINMHMPKPYGRYPLAGKKINNYNDQDLKDLLVDVGNHDFRPKSQTSLTSGDLIGPYTSVDETITSYSIPGQKLQIASHPIPRNGTVVGPRDSLMFRPGFRCAFHDVYVSTKNGDVPPNRTRKLFGEDNVVTLSRIQWRGVFQWRVDCVEEGTGNVREGDTWIFEIQR